jgi:predicted P-loop ATPase
MPVFEGPSPIPPRPAQKRKSRRPVASGNYGNGDWKDLLIKNQEGKPKALMANAETALRLSEEWAGRLAFDAFANEIWDHQRQQYWSDIDDLRAAKWMQHVGIFVSPAIVRQAAELTASANTFHPVRAYLDSLEWDGTKRLDTWTLRYLGAEDSAYMRAVSARWMISAIARICDPGCKADCLLVLEGEQGTLKSSALKILGGDWFTDELAEVGSKDAAMQLSGVWIIEIAELDSIKHRDVSRVKAYLSRTHDRFRPPYGRAVVRLARQTVFCATTNETEWGRDETGLRRFWPVACGTIDIEGLRGVRDQLWAEARDCYRAGEVWWLDTDDLTKQAKAVQEERQASDAWIDLIRDIVGTRNEISVAECLRDLGFKQQDYDRASQMRVAACLKQLDFERFRARNGRDREWKYRRKMVLT